ncbi:metal ABC transporter ATP-binding protein [Siccirubricoccus sp. KC 17139]|uniref:Metal ABC transporter ATP-binding protein n=1 Tax=Siccirubricoccus soli TaxID=2899147 RepID=A0ABT1DBE6_9PROT|nr:metal ABC transporter ATP-binding protein [Siccirubricoccus soli]MCO6418499.1 metal ABC transporter ATP-binding protein [Siccirubricoccus soli]MCP2684634.1 metal ABC transporter ATP-binding protein [Siccirubricoccus soli]
MSGRGQGGAGVAVPEIRLADLTCSYQRRPAVHHLNGRFAPGSLTAVVGPNGAGKSTLLRTLAGLHRPDHGRIEGAAGRVALLPQATALDRAFPITCLDVVMFGLWADTGGFRAIGAAGRAKAREALAAIGLEGFEARPVGSLSAGQFQRLLFARLLLQDAPVILLDEPFNALDARTAAELLAMVHRWHGEGRTVIAVLHDLDLVRRDFPETLLLARDCLGWGPTAEVLTAANRLRARMMTEAWDPEAGPCTRPDAA